MSSHPPLSSRSALWIGLLLVGLVCPAVPSKAGVVVQIGQNFTGSTYGVDSPYNPPDCNGVAGPDHFVELINGRFSVYAKTNGVRLLTMSSAEFWTNTGLTFDSGVIISDPRLVYDPSVQRWFASAIDVNRGISYPRTNRFLVAVSKKPDPADSWRGLAFVADPTNGNFADFPTLGVDANGVYLAAFMFTSADPQASDVGQTLVSIPKADLLAPVPSADNRTWFGILDSTNYGYVLQPAVNFDTPSGDATVLAMGDLGYDFISHSNLVSFAVQNAASPGPATLTASTNIGVEPYSVPINPTQPDGNNTLDDGDARFSAKVYQVGGILYGVHGCQVDNRAALRWYKIDAASHIMLQSGTIADTNLDLFYGSIAANPSGTVVIGFNGCSTHTFVSSFAVVGETSQGLTTFGAPLLLKSGVASYSTAPAGGISRWGDYSTTCVDPADPNRFWSIQMYPTSAGGWATQITELLTIIPTLTIAPAGTNVVLCWPATPIAFDLESAGGINATNWTMVPQTMPWATNGQVCVEVPASESVQFFRLHEVRKP